MQTISDETTYKSFNTRLAQLVERTPFKLVVVGSSPTSGADSDETTYKSFNTRLAQLVERMPFKRVVVGSSPTSGARAVRDALPKSPKLGNGGIFHLTMELLVIICNSNYSLLKK